MAREWSTPTVWADNKAINTTRLTLNSTLLSWLYKTLSADEGTALTISSGVISVTGNESYYKVSGEGPAADDLVTINGGTEDDILILAYDGEVITIQDGDGNIETGDYGDLQLRAAGHSAIFRYDGSNWVLLATNALNFKVVHFQEVYDAGNSGASKTIDWNKGNKQKVTLTGDCTFAFTAPPGPCNLTLQMIGDGTARSLTWPGSLIWMGVLGEPDWSGDSGDKNLVSLFFDGSDYQASGAAPSA